jgi:hypothetical protein
MQCDDDEVIDSTAEIYCWFDQVISAAENIAALA